MCYNYGGSFESNSNSHYTEDTNLKTFTVTCDPGPYYNKHRCQNNTTLTGIAVSAKKKSHAQININIMIPVLYLNDAVRFSNLKSLSIISRLGSTAIMCPANNKATAGIILSNITDTIILKNLNLSLCGYKVSETRPRVDDNISENLTSALAIIHSRNVEMSQIVIANSSGLGLTILDHQGGKVELLSTIFQENKLTKENMEVEKLGLRGGGIYIAVEQHKGGRYSDTSFIFEDCMFLNNNSSVGTSTHYTLAHTHQYDQGGGAYFSFKRDSLANIRVSFLRCQFLANQAYAGGGLSISVQGENNIQNAKVLIEMVNSRFEHNGCDKCAGTQHGGALQLTLVDASYSMQSNISVQINNVTFIGNCAEIGGAIYYLSHQGTPTSNSTMLFEGCTFIHNKAYIGSATCMAMIPDHSLNLFTGHGYKLSPTFHKCYFKGNFVYKKHFQLQRNTGVGTVYASLYTMHFEGTNVFNNNVGSGLFIVNGIINTTFGGLSFINNTGINGGAVALIE